MFSRYIGSYGRDTAINNFSDLDMVFILPSSAYTRFNNYIYNGQSALLQEVKSSIEKTYPSTKLGADGIIIKVEFSDNLNFEVIPVFEQKDKSFKHAVSNDGGSWKIFDPLKEITVINDVDSTLKGNLKRLCKMTRAWISKWNVPLGGLLADTLAHNFLINYGHRNESYFYYDFFARDFFKYLSEQNSEQYYWYAPGSNQFVYRKGNFEYKAKQCYNIALEAIEYQTQNSEWSAMQKWREIYGTYFP